MSVLRRGPAHVNTGTVVLVFAVVAALYFAREILIPLAFALTLSFLLTPPVTFLEKLRMGRVFPVLLTVLVTRWRRPAGSPGSSPISLLMSRASCPRIVKTSTPKLRPFASRGKGPLGRAADSAKDIGRELSSPDDPAIPPLTAQNQKQRNAPRAPAPPVPVQIVQTRTKDWPAFPDLLTPFIAPLGRAGIDPYFYDFHADQARGLDGIDFSGLSDSVS